MARLLGLDIGDRRIGDTGSKGGVQSKSGGTRCGVSSVAQQGADRFRHRDMVAKHAEIAQALARRLLDRQLASGN